MAFPPSSYRRPDLTQHKFDLHVALSKLPVETREIAAQEGLVLLQVLQAILKAAPDSIDVSAWLDQAQRAFDQMYRKKPTIAIVGSTGAGKTSFINAVIDEESLLPTNCMRACTATITEISYNDRAKKYRAEIEFLTRDDWRAELERGFQVLFGSSGRIVADATNEDSEAGIFYSKIRAVYASMTRLEIEDSTVESLMQHDDVGILGHSETFEDNDAAAFSQRLQKIIDSKDKFGRGFGGEVAHWPIIRRVRLLVRAPALSTGVTLVDLPGVQDSTPARAQIAEEYKKTCSGLIVTAPIQRAADDRIAKNLLGPVFRRQVMMDGGYSTMTFVCTKADEINIAEISCSPELKDGFNRLAKEANQLLEEQTETQRHLTAAIPLLREAEDDLTRASAKVDALEDVLRLARAAIDAAQPSISSEFNAFGKRLAEDDNPLADPKRQARGNEELSSMNSQAETDKVTDEGESQEDMDLSRTRQDFESLNAQSSVHIKSRDEAKQRKDDRARELKDLEDKLQGFGAAISRLEEEKRSQCIQYRNRYVVNALKHDFVAGVKERDQERLAEEDVDNWDPATQTRDYEKLGAELPVLTVSSRAYQQKMGRLVEEGNIRGFMSVEDTGIPAAVRHCQQLTHAARVKNSDFFLAMFSKMLNSLRLWMTNEINGTNLSDVQREQVRMVLHQRLAALKNSFSKAISEAIDEIRRAIRAFIINHLDSARKDAVSKSGPTAKAWAGLANPTWKAICRREGAYTNENGSYDWNEDLVAPLLDHIAPQWEQAFSATLTKPFETFSTRIRKKIKDFHTSIPDLLAPFGLNAHAPLQMLGAQNREHKHTLSEIAFNIIDKMQCQQKEINRSFKPCIVKAMVGAYRYCLNENGPGSQKRMTEHMKTHVEKERHMFRDATKTVQKQLEELMADVKKELKVEVEKIHAEISRSYVSTFCGNEMENENMTDARQVFGADVGRFLEQCKNEFDGYMRGPLVVEDGGGGGEEDMMGLEEFLDSNMVREPDEYLDRPVNFDKGPVVKQEFDDEQYAAALQAEENEHAWSIGAGVAYRQVGKHLVIDD